MAFDYAPNIPVKHRRAEGALDSAQDLVVIDAEAAGVRQEKHRGSAVRFLRLDRGGHLRGLFDRQAHRLLAADVLVRGEGVQRDVLVRERRRQHEDGVQRGVRQRLLVVSAYSRGGTKGRELCGELLGGGQVDVGAPRWVLTSNLSDQKLSPGKLSCGGLRCVAWVVLRRELTDDHGRVHGDVQAVGLAHLAAADQRDGDRLAVRLAGVVRAAQASEATPFAPSAAGA